MKSAAITFGRFNPFTIGHLKLVQAVGNQPTDDHLVYMSHSFDAVKNPLPYEEKLEIVRTLVAENVPKVEVVDSNAKTFMHVLNELTGKYDEIYLVVGSDRVVEFQASVDKYNGVPDKRGVIPFSFDSIEVVSAGERDPDAEGVEGMSATKMRQAAADNDFEAFRIGTPTTNTQLARDIFDSVREHMSLRESHKRRGLLEEEVTEDEDGTVRGVDFEEVEDEEEPETDLVLSDYFDIPEEESPDQVITSLTSIADSLPLKTAQGALVPITTTPGSEQQPQMKNAEDQQTQQQDSSSVIVFLTTADPPSRMHAQIKQVISIKQKELRFSSEAGGNWSLSKSESTVLPVIVGVIEHKNSIISSKIAAAWLSRAFPEITQEANKSIALRFGDIESVFSSVVKQFSTIYIVGDERMKSSDKMSALRQLYTRIRMTSDDQQTPRQVASSISKPHLREDEGVRPKDGVFRITNASFDKVDSPNIVVTRLLEVEKEYRGIFGQLIKQIHSGIKDKKETTKAAKIKNESADQIEQEEKQDSQDSLVSKKSSFFQTLRSEYSQAFQETALLTEEAKVNQQLEKVFLSEFREKFKATIVEYANIFAEAFKTEIEAAKEFLAMGGITQISDGIKDIQKSAEDNKEKALKAGEEDEKQRSKKASSTNPLTDLGVQDAPQKEDLQERVDKFLRQ